MNELEQIGAFLRSMRRSRKLSQRALGSLLARPVSGSNISAIERGKSPLSIKTLLALADELGFVGKIKFSVKPAPQSPLFDETSLQNQTVETNTEITAE